MQQPQGYIQQSNQHVLRLKKAMYGLKQSRRAWYKCLSAAMNKIQSTKSKSDAAVFFRHSGKGFVIIAVAVDDLMITVINDDIVCKIKADLMMIFKMKDLGKLHWLLNLKIERDRTSKFISFSQEAYIDKILSHFNLQDSKMHITPIDLNIHLSKDQFSSTDEEKVAMSKIPYREEIGSLMWAAVATQPDIAFAVSLLSQFLENLGDIHWKAVKRVMRYLSGTNNYKLTLGKNRDSLLGYADAD